MSSKVQCYLRTLRLQWGLTQKELASLLPKGSRNRVSFVERGLVPPNAGEILAYRLIFGVGSHAVFRKVSEEVDEVVLQRVYRLYESLEGNNLPKAVRKRELIDQILARAINNIEQREV